MCHDNHDSGWAKNEYKWTKMGIDECKRVHWGVCIGQTRKWGRQSHRGHGLSASMTAWPGNFPDEWTSAWVNEWCERVMCECMSDCEQICECICRCGQVCEWEHKSVSEYWVHNMWLYVWDCGCECIQVCGCVCVCLCVCVCGVCGGGACVSEGEYLSAYVSVSECLSAYISY